jgi:hypothetical protein
MSPLERETKLVLNPEDFQRLRAAGTLLEERDQLNVYLHDPNRLSEGLGYVRVRFEEGREAVATLKIPSGWRGDMREMVEVERPLSELGPAFSPRPRRWVVVDADVPEGFLDHLGNLGIRRLRRLGWMRNHRSVVELPGLGTIELDRTTLPGGAVHFEVEVENPVVAVHEALVAEVKVLAPSARASRVGKFSRFLAAVGLAPSPPSNPS